MRDGKDPERTTEATFRRMAKVKQIQPPAVTTLGTDLVGFFKNSVQKKHNRLGRIAEVWLRLVPETLIEHTSLESFQTGTLKVLVDTASHLYELKTVMLAGLEKQIVSACRSEGLRKISLKSGRWYDDDEAGRQKIRFD